jgi:site-specific DNA recombinase
MRAAIYARRSVKETKTADEAKSVERQKENARAFAEKQGWTVSDEHVFVDDGISGAELERRPAFMRLVSLLDHGRPFDRLVVSEQKTLSRNLLDVQNLIERFTEADVEVWSYTEGLLTPQDDMGEASLWLRGWGAKNERVKASERMHEAHTRLAGNGYVTGGRVFGYRNRRISKGVDRDGNAMHSHVDGEINLEEAAVVRRAFELYADGHGLKAVAHRLNAERAVTPRYAAPKDAPSPIGAWTPSTARALLGREIYKGVVVWNQQKNRNRRTGKVERVRSRRRRPESEWVKAVREDLRIVSDALWASVSARRGEVAANALRFQDGRLCGRPPKGAEVNLLAGLAACGVCGGGLNVGGRAWGRRTALQVRPTSGGGSVVVPGPYRVYECRRYRHLKACTNALRVPFDTVNAAVLQAIEEHVSSRARSSRSSGSASERTPSGSERLC